MNTMKLTSHPNREGHRLTKRQWSLHSAPISRAHPRVRGAINRGHGTSLAKRAPKAAPHWSKRVSA